METIPFYMCVTLHRLNTDSHSGYIYANAKRDMATQIELTNAKC